MWLDAVGMADDFYGYLDDLPAYRQMSMRNFLSL
jgi:hypothetical protein